MLYVKPNITVVIRQLKFVQCLKTKSMSTIGLIKRTYLNEVTKSQTINFVYEWTGRRCMSMKAEELTKKLDSDCVKPGDVDETKLDDVDLNYLEEIEGNQLDLGDINFKEDNLELFKEIANGNDNIFQILRNIQVAINVLESQYNTTLNLTKQDWIKLLDSKKRKKDIFIKHLLIKAKTKNAEDKEKLRKKELLFRYDSNTDTLARMDPNCYHLFHNSLHIKFQDQSLRQMAAANVMKTLMYGPELLIDCSYNKYMSAEGVKSVARQLSFGFTANFKSIKPYHIVLCNFDRNSLLAHKIETYSKSFYRPGYPVSVTSKSYLDLYPKDSLVYLTPHCKRALTKFEPSKRYIIGAFDRGAEHPVSMAKAKTDDIKMGKFPLDQYLKWARGSKSLKVDTCVKIMLLMSEYNEWNKAFEVIPQRHLGKDPEEEGKSKSMIYIPETLFSNANIYGNIDKIK